MTDLERGARGTSTERIIPSGIIPGVTSTLVDVVGGPSQPSQVRARPRRVRWSGLPYALPSHRRCRATSQTSGASHDRGFTRVPVYAAGERHAARTSGELPEVRYAD